MSRPLLLDLFCGAGGAAVGYHRAGFDVVGVDIKPQPHYPFEFYQADALDILRGTHHVEFSVPHSYFDAIHASPPCQGYSVTKSINPKHGEYPQLVGDTIELLKATGLPWVCENVVGAPMENPLMLCGTMFPPLRVIRHRLFDSSHLLMQPPHHPKHPRIWFPYDKRGRGYGSIKPGPDEFIGVYGHQTPGMTAAAAMGIDWMTRDELNESIPPPYTQWIGAQLLAQLRVPA